jgi:hypothetical protein
MIDSTTARLNATTVDPVLALGGAAAGSLRCQALL